jgi:hypothetical protein
VFSKISSQ